MLVWVFEVYLYAIILILTMGGFEWALKKMWK